MTKPKMFNPYLQTKYLYFLRDPSSNIVKYVGITTDPKKRLDNHIRAAKAVNSTPVHKWVNGLREQDKLPLLNVIYVLNNVENWQAVEEFWISAFGDQLLNITSGGGGRKDSPHSEEVRSEIGRKLRNRSLSIKTKEEMKISQQLRRSRGD